MNSIIPLKGFAIFILVVLNSAEPRDYTHEVQVKEFPFGPAELDYPISENPGRTAVIRPAAAITYDGGCSLTKRFCDSSTAIFGEERKNSKVDFRQKQTVFWEFAVPPTLETAEFLCKPGNTVSLNISQKVSRNDYLCENAVGYYVENKTSSSNQSLMAIDLKDGDDEVYLGDLELPAIFLMGTEGQKIFHGGKVYNEYRIDSHCNGRLTGDLVAEHQAVSFIIISGNCTRGKHVNIVISSDVNNTLVIGSNVNITFSRIRLIYLDRLSLRFSYEKNWNLTLIHLQDGWVSVPSNEASGFTATFCRTENLTWEDWVTCTSLWQYFYLWISSICIFVSIIIFICLITCVCVNFKRKTNANMAFEMVSMVRFENLPKED